MPEWLEWCLVGAMATLAVWAIFADIRGMHFAAQKRKKADQQGEER